MLPMALVGFKIESAVRVDAGDVTILRAAAITHEGIGDDKIQDDIQERGGEENGVGEQGTLESPSNAAGKDSYRNDGNSQPLGEVFAHEKVGAGANQAFIELALVERLAKGGYRQCAVRAHEGPSLRWRLGAHRRGTVWTRKKNVHGRESTSLDGNLPRRLAAPTDVGEPHGETSIILDTKFAGTVAAT